MNNSFEISTNPKLNFFRKARRKNLPDLAIDAQLRSLYTQRMGEVSIPRRSWDWPSAILVLLLIQVSAARLVMTSWAPFLFFTQTLAAYSVILGLALGYSTFHRRVVTWLALLYTIVIVPWQLVLAIQADAPLLERLASLGGRMWFSFGQFVTRKPVDDSLFFVAFVSLGYWLIGLTAGYYLTRYKNYLAVVLPAGLAALIVQLYDYFLSIRIWELAVYIFLALVLLGRLYVSQNHSRWEHERVFVTSESVQDLRNSLLVISALIVFLAWSLPTSLSSLQSAAQTWNDFSKPLRERLSNAVTSLNSTHGSASGGDFYGNKLALGRDATLGNNLIFTVRISGPLDSQPPRYYWRGRVYDFYSNGQWANTIGTSQAFSPTTDQVTLAADEEKQRETVFTFTSLTSRLGLLYVPEDTFWVNRPGSILATTAPDASEDPLAWLAKPTLSAGDRYQVRARIADPTIEDLRGAGENYPDWVISNYLQVPDNVAAQLKPLASELAQNQNTPFDKAEAITDFLRTQITYSIKIDAPPSNSDPVLWVLFDYKKGFCTYYASAEVLMLRTLGIPARMAVGFAQGTVQENNGSGNSSYGYNVHQADAHAWPEVYFPNIGWVEFEPTASQAPLVRPTIQSPTTPSANSGLTFGPPALQQEPNQIPQNEASDANAAKHPPFFQTPLGHATLTVLLLALLGIMIWAGRRYELMSRLPIYISDVYSRNGSQPPNWIERWANWSRLTPIERSFHAINVSLSWLGKPQPMHITPTQRADILRSILPSANAAIDSLLAEHQAALYSPRPGNPTRARRAAITLLAYTVRARLFTTWNHLRVRFTLG